MTKARGPAIDRTSLLDCHRPGAGDCTGCRAGADPASRTQPSSPPTPEVTFKVEVNYVEEAVRVDRQETGRSFAD